MRNSFSRSHQTARSAFLRAFAQIEHPSGPQAEISSDALANQLVARFNRRTASWEPADGAPMDRAEFRAWRTIRSAAWQAGDLHIYARLRKPGIGRPGLSAQTIKPLERRGGD